MLSPVSSSEFSRRFEIFSDGRDQATGSPFRYGPDEKALLRAGSAVPLHNDSPLIRG
jgi:hypothetical protein